MDQLTINTAVRRYREGLERIFGDQLVAVILYGSCARREAGEDSDIDLLCVLRTPFDYWDAIRRSSALTARISLEEDVVLSRVFVSEHELQNRDLPFFINVRHGGVPT